MALNEFSDLWLSAFLDQRDEQGTQHEVEFLAAFLEPGSAILDMACGYGRHATILSNLGHQVTGMDRDARMLSRARRVCTAVQAEMRQLPFADDRFDAALNMWQSFGYFSASENAGILRELARIVRPGGLFVLDLYTRGFYESVSGSRRFARAGAVVDETTKMRGDRVNVRLTYNDGSAGDEFEWQVFTPHELEQLALETGWTLVGRFADFDPGRSADDNAPRIQHVFKRQHALPPD